MKIAYKLGFIIVQIIIHCDIDKANLFIKVFPYEEFYIFNNKTPFLHHKCKAYFCFNLKHIYYKYT